MSKIFGGLVVVMAACGYPGLPPLTGAEQDAPAADDTAPIQLDAAIDSPPIDGPPADGVTVAPRVDVSVGSATINPELMTTSTITVVVRASDGFTGNVTLAAAALDTTSNPIPAWALSLADTTLAVPLNGVATTSVTLTLPAKKTKLDGSVKITLTAAGTAGTHAASTTVSIKDQVTWQLRVDNVTTKCVYPQNGGTGAAPVVLALGTKVRFFNNGTAEWQLHATGLIDHQTDTTPAGGVYEQTPSSTGTQSWYCHIPGPDIGANDPAFRVE